MWMREMAAGGCDPLDSHFYVLSKSSNDSTQCKTHSDGGGEQSSCGKTFNACLGPLTRHVRWNMETNSLQRRVDVWKMQQTPNGVAYSHTAQAWKSWDSLDVILFTFCCLFRVCCILCSTTRHSSHLKQQTLNSPINYVSIEGMRCGGDKQKTFLTTFVHKNVRRLNCNRERIIVHTFRCEEYSL